MAKLIFYIIISLLLAIVAEAQPVPPSVGYPLKLERGGTELNNTLTAVNTNGTINNLALTTSVIRFGGGTAQTLTGIVSSAKSQRVLLINANGAQSLQINHESTSSTAANRFTLPNSANYSIPYNTAREFVYDTTTSRWRMGAEIVNGVSPLYKTNAGIAILQASSGNSGYISASDYTTYVDNWAQTSNDVYNTNLNNVWISLYPCSDFNANYSNCVSYGCTPQNTGDCTTFNSDEAGCNAAGGASQCTWNSGDSTCSGNYFVSCSGSGYRKDDGTQSKLQVKATVQCSGTATACSTWSNSSGQTACNNQDGCGTWVGETCTSQPDESSCSGIGSPCSWGGHYCGGDNSSGNSCPSQTNQTNCDALSGGGCSSDMTGDCTSASNTDQATCEALNANGGDCAWSDPDCSGTGYFVGCSGDNSVPNTCGNYNEDESSCNANGCSYVPDSCSGDNSSCPGTATACSTYSDGSLCASQAGCSYSATPALRAQGDNITTSDGYLQFLKTAAGAPTGTDCDSDSEYGRLAIDTTNERLYICNGASRQWDYVALNN